MFPQFWGTIGKEKAGILMKLFHCFICFVFSFGICPHCWRPLSELFEGGWYLLKCTHTSSFSNLSHLMYPSGFFLLASFCPCRWVSWIEAGTTQNQFALLIMVHTWSLGTPNPISHAKILMCPRPPQSRHLSDGVTSKLPVSPLDSSPVNQVLSTLLNLPEKYVLLSNCRSFFLNTPTHRIL